MGLDGLREARDDDASSLAELIGGVYAEYAGCVLDLPGVDADLTAIRSHLAAQGGRLWVLDGPPGIVACVGYAPDARDPTQRLELKRLYVRASHRASGLGSALVEHVLTTAAVLGVAEVDLWSDTRFAAGHRLYERLGWVRDGRQRQLHDPSDTTESHFRRSVDPPQSSGGRYQSETAPGTGRVHRSSEWTAHVAGTVAAGTDSGTFAVTFDELRRPRHVVATSPRGRVALGSDGLGRWWRDGQVEPRLAHVDEVEIAGIQPAADLGVVSDVRAPATTGRVAWPDLSIEV